MNNVDNDYCKNCGSPLLYPDKPCPKCGDKKNSDNININFFQNIENKFNIIYESIFKSPFWLAILAFALSLLFSSELSGVTIYREAFIIAVLSIVYTIKFKEIMTKSYKFKFALYFTLIFLIRDITTIILAAASNSYNFAYILLSSAAILIALTIKNILRPVYSYLTLLIFNRIFILLTKIKNNIFKNILQLLSNLVDKPRYIVSLGLFILIIQFCYLSFTSTGGKFISAGEINIPRLDLSSSVKMSNGKIFILEENYYNPKTKFYIYDPKSKKISTSGELKAMLNKPKAIELKNGKILILGFTEKRFKTEERYKKLLSDYEKELDKYGELYDPNTGEITLTGENLFPNFVVSMTELADGKVLISGGAGMSKKSQIYDPKTNKFYQTGDLNQGRANHNSILLKNGKVLIFGGMSNNAELYNPSTRTFSIIPNSFKTSWGSHPPQLLPLEDGRIFISCVRNFSSNELSGNSVKEGHLNQETNKFEYSFPGTYVTIYNPDNNNFQEVKLSNKYSVQDFEVALLKDGKVLVTGGKVGRGKMRGYLILDQAEIFNPKTNKFTPVKNKMKVPRYAHSTLTLENGNVLIIGGVNNNQFTVKQAELFIP